MIFGGYTSLSWESPVVPVDKADPKAFLFSLTKQSIHPVKTAYNAVTHRRDALAVFGQAYDLVISNNCD